MTYLLPQKTATQTLGTLRTMMESMPVRRVEQIGKRCLMERYDDPRTGMKIQRITLTIPTGKP